MPSFKFPTQFQYPFAGTNGHIYIGLRPVASNDSFSAYILDTANAPNATTVGDVFAGTPITAIGSPFVGASFGTGKLEQRLVGCGIRITNTEPALYTQGSITGYWTPSGATLSADTVVDSLFTNYNARRMTKHNALEEGHPFSMCYDLDDELAAQEWFPSPVLRAQGGLSCVIHIPASAIGVTANTGLLELVSHWEARGHTVASFAMPNPSEPTAFSKAYTAVANTLRTAAHTVYSSPELLHFVGTAMSSSMGIPAISALPLRGIASARSQFRLEL